MAGLFTYSYFSQPKNDINFNGGLNSTNGPLSLKDTESSDLQNILFNKFGSILKRNGYLNLNSTVSSGSVQADGLMWFEYITSGGVYASNMLEATNGKMLQMSNLDGTWHDITGAATITAGNFFQSTNWYNTIYMTNGKDSPLQWNGTSNVTTLPALQANSYTFTVYSITTAPTVGATYTNNTVTYTVAYVNVSGTAGSIAGTIIMTGNGTPSTYGTLTKASGTGDSTISFSLEVLNANITSAKYITQWNNFLFLANVNINNGTYLPTRIYWCQVNDPTTWSAINWIEISTLDGQPITGMYPLADRLVIFKERSIYNLFFTGDSTLPFVTLVSNSPTVGCMAPYSIQEVENGLVFLSFDGFYYYDSNNAYKMSLQIQNTISGLNLTKLQNARSVKQRNKNLYLCAVTGADSTTNDTVITWDWVLNAFSIYKGMAPSAMRAVFVNGNQEQIYFSDYFGYTYQMDTGVDDYPLKVQTPISAYYWTNWKSFGDAMLQKADPNVVIYYESSNSVLTFGYSYDFDQGLDYTNTFSLAQGTAVWGSAIWDSSLWSGSGGLLQRQDLDGRGRVMRFYFANANMSETFQIDGMASFVNVETNE
jgi:hypothetical protein